MVLATRKRGGRYLVGGNSYQMLVGSRVQVYNGTAQKTGYGKKGLKKGDLIRNKWVRIVSRKKHLKGKTSGLKRLHAKGWFVKKGTFGATQRKGSPNQKTRKKGKRCRNAKGNRFAKCPK